MSNPLKHLAALMLGVIALAGMPASAQEQAPPQTVTNFNDATVSYLLRDMGATWRVERGPDGVALYRARSEGNINFTLAPTACGQEGCTALILIAVFNDFQADDLARFDTYLHAFNDQNASAKVVRNSNGIIALQGFVNARGGISYANLQAQILLFGENIFATTAALRAYQEAEQ